MSTQDTNGLNPLDGDQAKDRAFNAQLVRVYKASKEKPMTMKEVDQYTGIMRENVCRHVAKLLEQGRIAVTRKRKCRVTGYPYVNEYTGDPVLFPKSDQLKLF